MGLAPISPRSFWCSFLCPSRWAHVHAITAGMVAVSLAQISSTCSSARTSERRMLVTALGSVSK
jgi:hypothetical protein